MKDRAYLMETLEKYREIEQTQGRIPDIFEGLLNEEVTISEKQITEVTVLIGLTLQRHEKPTSLDFLPIATFINSCH